MKKSRESITRKEANDERNENKRKEIVRKTSERKGRLQMRAQTEEGRHRGRKERGD